MYVRTEKCIVQSSLCCSLPSAARSACLPPSCPSASEEVGLRVRVRVCVCVRACIKQKHQQTERLPSTATVSMGRRVQLRSHTLLHQTHANSRTDLALYCCYCYCRFACVYYYETPAQCLCCVHSRRCLPLPGQNRLPVSTIKPRHWYWGWSRTTPACTV